MAPMNLVETIDFIKHEFITGKAFTIDTVEGTISVQIVNTFDLCNPIKVFKKGTTVYPSGFNTDYVVYSPNMSKDSDFSRLFYAAEITSQIMYLASFNYIPFQEYVDACTLSYITDMMHSSIRIDDLVNDCLNNWMSKEHAHDMATRQFVDYHFTIRERIAYQLLFGLTDTKKKIRESHTEYNEYDLNVISLLEQVRCNYENS